MLTLNIPGCVRIIFCEISGITSADLIRWRMNMSWRMIMMRRSSLWNRSQDLFADAIIFLIFMIVQVSVHFIVIMFKTESLGVLTLLSWRLLFNHTCRWRWWLLTVLLRKRFVGCELFTGWNDGIFVWFSQVFLVLILFKSMAFFRCYAGSVGGHAAIIVIGSIAGYVLVAVHSLNLTLQQIQLFR